MGHLARFTTVYHQFWTTSFFSDAFKIDPIIPVVKSLFTGSSYLHHNIPDSIFVESKLLRSGGFRVPESYDALVGFRAAAGFALSGFLLALPAACLPAWGLDVDTAYPAAGLSFLAVSIGLVLSAPAARVVRPLRARGLLCSGAMLAVVALFGLAFAGQRLFARMAGIATLGLASGMLHAGFFATIERDSASALQVCGVFFGLGSTLAVTLAALSFYEYRIDTTLLFLAAIPAAALIVFASKPLPSAAFAPQARQFRGFAALLLSLLLCFQFGNEWAIGGWLPIFLIHRLGISPASALALLAFYFSCIAGSRAATTRLYGRVNEWWILAIGAAASLFGLLILAATDNRFGASVGTILTGLGFGAVYLATAAWTGSRFPFHQPEFASRLFSLTLAGGMIAPWLCGELIPGHGMGTVALLPAIGTGAGVLLLSLLWVQRRVTGE